MFGGENCISWGYDYGALTCTMSCTISDANCQYCMGGDDGMIPADDEPGLAGSADPFELPC